MVIYDFNVTPSLLKSTELSCKEMHYNFVGGEIINAYMLLAVAVLCIYGSWLFFQFASPQLLDKYYDYAMMINRFSAILILAFIAFQFIYSYDAFFPEVRPKFELVIKIFIGYLIFNLAYRAFWYFKDKK